MDAEYPLTLLVPGGYPDGRCGSLLDEIQSRRTVRTLDHLEGPLQGQRILFAAALDDSGIHLELCRLIALLRTHPDWLEGSVGGVLIDGAGDLYTKSAARDLVQAANGAGCTFPGRPLVEVTGQMQNFTVQARNAGCSLEEACRLAALDLARRVAGFARPRSERPRIAVLHASSHRTSNTLALWSRVREQLSACCDMTEIGLRNGALEDCAGCPYTACLHFGEKGLCFYGGVMVQEVYPAVRDADAIVMLCPNYNDALSANLSACINRLTALYRTTSFDRKALFGIVVSGYSGGDIVQRQLISALCMNKGFWLPPRFCLLETANDAGTALKLPDIDSRLTAFAGRIRAQLTGCAEDDTVS